jgi:hypothetical protein
MRTSHLAWALLVISLVFSLVGLCVAGFQSIGIWQAALAGRRFHNLDAGLFEWAAFVALLSAPVITALCAMRLLNLKMRGLAIAAVTSSLVFAIYSCLCVAILYANADG